MSSHSQILIDPATAIPGPSPDVPVIEVKGLTKHFPIKAGLFRKTVATVQAVTDVSFKIAEGRTMALVGESGCGKTTAGRALLRLIQPTSGGIFFRGRPIHDLPHDDLVRYRRMMQIIFQDPFSSLNPRMTVDMIVGEAMVYHGIATEKERKRKVGELLDRVGLSPTLAGRYPHEFSGGQRQRIGIARALAVNPAFIVCDEAVSALDVSVQAQIINLLMDLQKELGIAYLFIAHDMAVVRHISHDIAVMYLGRIVETGSCASVFNAPQHPYTQALLSAVPPDEPGLADQAISLKGEPPSPIRPPRGCAFAPRCPYRQDGCSDPAIDAFPLTERQPGHFSRCRFVPNDWKAWA